jgi:hypothetical protein
MSTLTHVYSRVHNRGIPPQSFIDTLIAWEQTADPEIFAPAYRGDEEDLYDSITEHRFDLRGFDRRALMCESLRVLAGFESSWRWTEGRDVTNATSNRPETTEAGIFQVSGNSLVFSPSLLACFLRHGGELIKGKPDYALFQKLMKSNHTFAIEYAARLLRFTIRHNGPVMRGEIHPWMQAGAVKEFEQVIGTPDMWRADIAAGLGRLDGLLAE